MRSFRRLVAFFSIALVLSAPIASAGGGPENVFVVVNPKSLDSLTIANHFCRLRQIHPSNVYHLPWSGSRDTVDVETFRNSILGPILNEVARRHLHNQIDYIVYSSGYPYAVDFSADGRVPLADKSGAAVGSLTGLTFHHERVNARQISYAFSFEQPSSNLFFGPRTQGFRNQYGWRQQGQRTRVGGEHYYLSVMLGYTDGRGNTLDEVIRYLQRSTLADSTQPEGTFYMMRVDGEVRSETRHDGFPQVKTALNQLGARSAIESGVLPRRKSDVLGIITGRSEVRWEQSASHLQPGAVFDNLTSFGGVLKSGATQTPLTDFLKQGAAGATGTVVEPFALQPKFPVPWWMVHYRQGTTMAEALYQAVACPYQLLIVGDPLCSPWARPPQVLVDGLHPGQSIQGLVELHPETEGPAPVGEYQFFVDGRYYASFRPHEAIRLDSARLPDGHHELRIVAIEDSPIESQGRLILPVQIDNHGGSVEWTLHPEAVTIHQSATLHVRSPGAKSIHLYHGRRRLGRINRDEGDFQVDPRTIGEGPIELLAVAVRREDNRKVYSTPIQFMVRSGASQ